MAWGVSKLVAAYRERQAQKRLAELVAQTASSYEITRYRERRAAALKGHAIKRMRVNG